MFAVRARDQEVVFVTRDREQFVHLLDLVGGEPDLPQHVGAQRAVHMPAALIDAHGEHALQLERHRLGAAGFSMLAS